MPYALRPTLYALRPTPYALRATLFALCAMPYALFAQYFTIGTDPASVKWNQVRTENFRIIYPNTLDSHAVYLANAFEYYHAPGATSLNAKPRNWPVILHNRTVASNALVPYAPKRLEIYTMPPQDNYGQSWIDQLVLHEYRHMVQYTAVNRGLTRALSVVFGQQAVPGVIGLFVPLWFIEGDAVAMETANSRTGRGRVPSFEMKLRAQFLEKGIYSYDKAVNASYKDFTPDRYELGYQLVGHTRLQYGAETWSRVIKKTGNIPLMMVPFSNTLYQETGFGKSRLYDKITGELKQGWEDEDREKERTPFEPLPYQPKKTYSNVTRPVITGNGTVLARRTSLDDITRIVVIDSAGKEKILVTPGSMIDEGFSGSGATICWAEYDADPRWDLRSYSVIKTFDIETGKLRQITRKTRYFSPDLSADGQSIAAVEVDESSSSFLVIIDPESGDMIRRIPAPENYFLSYPAFSPAGDRVAVILTRSEGKSLAIADIETGEFEFLLPFSNTEISKPEFYGDYILFTGAYTGIDNIFAFSLHTRKLYQVTSARFGATDAAVSVERQMLVYADYTANGYALVQCHLDMESWQETDPVTEPVYALAEGLARQEGFIFHTDEVPDSAYAVKRYRKGLHLFNFHSWAPLAVDIDHMTLDPGVSLVSQNLLGTSFATLGYAWDLNEEAGKFYAAYRYEGFYPVMDLQTDYGLRRDVHKDEQGNQNPYKYHEWNVSAVLGLPLRWNVRSWFLGLRPSAGYSYKFLKMDPEEDLAFTIDRYNASNNRVFFYAQSRSAYRDLQPRWGQLLELNYNFTFRDGDSVNSVVAAEGLFYFPGPFRHHGLRIYGGYQHRISETYRFPGQVSVPRGYSGIFADRAATVTATYVLPVACPDWHIGPVLYLKRIRAGLFFDHMMVYDTEPYRHYQSAGVDLTFDFHLFRWFAPLEAGVRTVYRLNDKSVGFEFLYRLNLDSVY